MQLNNVTAQFKWVFAWITHTGVKIIIQHHRHAWLLHQQYTLTHLRRAFFQGVTQSRVVILYQRFGITYRSHLQGSRSPMKMGLICCPEMSVKNYHSKLCNIPREHTSHQHHGRSLKSRIVHLLLTCLPANMDVHAPYSLNLQFSVELCHVLENILTLNMFFFKSARNIDVFA
jgi:hypothetical protein